LRSARTILALSQWSGCGRHVLAPGIVPFPRGFAFGRDGRLFLASGIGPGGEGDDTIVAVAPGGGMLSPRLVQDPDLSPLDLVIAPNGNILLSKRGPIRRTGCSHDRPGI
jgi:hypothetical protein